MCLLMKKNKKINKNKNSNNNSVNVSYGEIDYPTFIISIEILARLLFTNNTNINNNMDIFVKQSIDTLIVDYILNNKEINNNKINEIDEKIEYLKELQNNHDIIEILQIAHKAFYPLFLYYSNENEGLMSCKNFMKFTKEFEIFPNLIGKAKLNSFFNGIAQYSMYDQKDSKDSSELIEHSLFVDLIALMALELNYPTPEPSAVEKILIFVDKISQSQGPGKIALNTGNNRKGNCGNFLDCFKSKYPWYFNEEKNIEEDFSSIMQNENYNDNNNGNDEKYYNNNNNNDYNNYNNNDNMEDNNVNIGSHNFNNNKDDEGNINYNNNNDNYIENDNNINENEIVNTNDINHNENYENNNINNNINMNDNEIENKNELNDNKNNNINANSNDNENFHDNNIN